ncbi:MAG: HAD-IC family P-type ATPase, partial [Acidobacteriota bacterium]|nr:HAD-IC family P-type ATPase [Acidobacteriota bacterium]
MASSESGASSAGLTSSEAQIRLLRHGPNRIEPEARHPVRTLLTKFWAPVPWMLEATIVLELLAHKPKEAAIIGALLFFNAILSFAQESQADRSLALLRTRLAVQARVLRDGQWQLVPAEQLVLGDVIRLRMGDLAPADVRLLEGTVQADESALTGESLPAEKAAGGVVSAGSHLIHGEATGEITGTGSRTYFGKTAELVKTARTASHLQEIIFAIVKYLVALDAALASALLVFALLAHMNWSEVLPFVVILLVASVPVALPATFTVATALGALEMSRKSVLVTRLSAIEEAAAMDVLCTDKTGTITQNRLSVARVAPLGNRGPEDVLRIAALASDAATQDPIDLAILSAARQNTEQGSALKRREFIPFDPAAKRSEALYDIGSGKLRVVKGSPASVAQLAAPQGGAAEEIERLAADGMRVIAVAAGANDRLDLYGFVGLADPLRPDSAALVRDLKNLGVRVIMVTGDTQETARAISAKVGIGARTGSVSDLQNTAAVLRFDAFAGVFPEDKFRLVQALQSEGHVVAMTGDGVNDAPALKEAEVGIAVANATDVAKAAASIVLIEHGLSGIRCAVETGRRVYQRMLTYTLNK